MAPTSTTDRARTGLTLAITLVLALNAGVLARTALSGSGDGPEASSTPPRSASSRSARTAVVTLDRGVTIDVHLPEGDGRHPVLVYVHGGGWTGGDRRQIPREFGVLDQVERGWAVVSVGYRHADLATGVTAVDQTRDVAAALDWVRGAGAAFGLDRHVVAMGHSAGAHLLAVVAAQAPAERRPDALLLVSGVYDFGPDVVGNPLLGPGARVARGCGPEACVPRADLHPARFVDGADPAVMLVHGAQDPIVSVATTKRYAAALTRADVRSSMHIVAGGGHDGPELGARVRALLDRLVDRSADR